MEQNGKLVTKTHIKYRSDQTATKGLKLYGVSTSDVESFPEALLTQTSVPIGPNGKNATFTHYTEYQSITFKNHLTQGGSK